MYINNINKKDFISKFNTYIELQDFRERNRFYNLKLHADIKAIIDNAISFYDFTNSPFEREYIESELLYHFLLKREALKGYKGNHYNTIFTLFRNKFYDILRTQKAREKREGETLSIESIYNE